MYHKASWCKTLELINEHLTRIVIFEHNKESLVFKPPLSVEQVNNEIKKAMLRKAEIRRYYLPNVDLEIIKTLVPPSYEQPWHTHKDIHEAMLVIEGEIEILIEKEMKIQKILLKKGDMIVVDRGFDTFHTVGNPTTEYSGTLTFKFLGPDKKQNEIFHHDWHGKK
jgi:quercetin dioxygenase-like cupin family protein